ncbi:DUF59 domain-containing protein [Candidatus Micrarchaeota archaeon]|nr:DUF59 domain-containing protein [Candidatus Micrarchaeota archaeon]
MGAEESVLEKLREVMDPELGINIVELGLIYGVEVEKEHATVKMTFTTPACPMLRHLASSVKEAAEKAEGVEEAEVQLVWDPPWSPEKISEEGKKKLGLE